MITGAIAVFIVVVCVIPALSNGEVGVGVIGIVIALALLFFGLIARSDARSYVNWTNYWSRNGKDRALLRRKWEAEAKAESERSRRTDGDAYERKQAERGLTKVGSEWTAGKVGYAGATRRCTCGGVMTEQNRITYSSGAVIVNYECGKCRKKLPVKVK